MNIRKTLFAQSVEMRERDEFALFTFTLRADYQYDCMMMNTRDNKRIMTTRTGENIGINFN